MFGKAYRAVCGHKTESLIYVVSVIGNAAAIPQIIRVWAGPANGVSLDSWAMYAVVSLVWIFYGVKIKQKPLIFANVCSLVANLGVVSGYIVNTGLK